MKSTPKRKKAPKSSASMTGMPVSAVELLERTRSPGDRVAHHGEREPDHRQSAVEPLVGLLLGDDVVESLFHAVDHDIDARAALRAFEVASFLDEYVRTGLASPCWTASRKHAARLHPDDEDARDETGELEGVLDERDGIDVREDVRFLEPELLEGPLASS